MTEQRLVWRLTSRGFKLDDFDRYVFRGKVAKIYANPTTFNVRTVAHDGAILDGASFEGPNKGYYFIKFVDNMIWAYK